MVQLIFVVAFGPLRNSNLRRLRESPSEFAGKEPTPDWSNPAIFALRFILGVVNLNARNRQLDQDFAQARNLCRFHLVAHGLFGLITSAFAGALLLAARSAGRVEDD